MNGYDLIGMECYYSCHMDEQTEQYPALAKKYSLVVTGGSDFHGEQAKPGTALGNDARKMNAQEEAAALAGLAARRGNGRQIAAHIRGQGDDLEY